MNGSPAPLRPLAATYRALAVCVRAGLAPLQVAATLAPAAGAAGRVVAGLANAQRLGQSLGEGLAALPGGLVPPWHAAILRAGEAAGRQAEALDQLAGACEAAARARAALTSAILGPVALLAGAAAFLPLPLLVRSGPGAWALLTAILSVPPALLLALPSLLDRADTTAGGTPRGLLALVPGVASLSLRRQRIHALRALAALAAAGVELGAALGLAGKAAGEGVVQEAAARAARSVAKGAPLPVVLVQSGFLEARHASFAAEAEATGRLDEAARRLAVVLESETEEFARVRLRLVAVALDVLSALLVAALILAGGLSGGGATIP